MWWRPAAAAVGWLVLGCGAGPPPAEDDAAVPDAGQSDGFVPLPTDAGPEPAPDAGPVDAGERDAGSDAGSCDCEPSSPCLMASCDTGGCLEVPSPNGVLCGEGDGQICVDGACVARECGDGYREPGASTAREGCDDGNATDGDLCSPACEPLAGLIAHDSTGDRETQLAPQGSSIGVDADGRVLFVWQEDGLSPNRAMAQRASPGGVPVGDPIEIDADVGFPPVADPRVAGLAGGGWVVVWHTLVSGSDFDVRYRLIAADGTAGGVRTAHVDTAGRQFEARVAALGDGFVIVWSSEIVGGPVGDFTVRARRFGDTGAALGGELEIPTTTTDTQRLPAVATSGTRWLVAWRHQSMTLGSTPRLYFRRYEGGTALDGAQVELSEGGADPNASVLDSGEFVVVWADGDIESQIVPRDATALDVADHATITTTSVGERFPVVAPLTDRDFVVAWVEQSAFDPVRFAASDASVLVPEATTLSTRLEAGAEQAVSVAPSPDGVWFLWSGYDGLTPSLALSAFHLPLD